MGLQQLCETLHKQRTHTQPQKMTSQRRGKKIKLHISHTPHNLSIFPWAYVDVTLQHSTPPPPRQHSTSIYHTYEAKVKQAIPTQGYVFIRSLKLSKYLNLGKRPQSEWFLETKPGRVAGLFGYLRGMGAC